MSSTESMATPAIPTSPETLTLSESYPRCVARSNATKMKIRHFLKLSVQVPHKNKIEATSILKFAELKQL